MKKKIFWIIPSLMLMLSGPGWLRAENTADYIAEGNQMANKKQYEEAIEQYQKALKINPKNNRAILLISLCYVESGDLDKGLSYAQRAAKNDPSYISFYNLGLIYSARREPDKALGAFDQALALSPESFNAEYQKGLVYTNLKKYDQAIPFYQKALTLNPFLDKARLALFGAFLDLGDRNSASAQIEEFRKMKKTAIVRALETRMERPNVNS
ncbi:MAG: tetratricopeptide repeat protein [Candidatus Omnitrophota bacterium]